MILAFTYDDSYLTEISHYFQKINIFLPCIILSNSLDGIKRTSKMRILIYSNFSPPTTVHTQGRNHRENLGSTMPMVGKICRPP